MRYGHHRNETNSIAGEQSDNCVPHADVPIIFTKHVPRADYKDAGLRLVRRSKTKEINSLVMGTWDSELDLRMNQRPEDYVLDNTRYSSFYHTSLKVILRGLGADTLIICGVTTEICVEFTIRDA